MEGGRSFIEILEFLPEGRNKVFLLLCGMAVFQCLPNLFSERKFLAAEGRIQAVVSRDTDCSVLDFPSKF